MSSERFCLGHLVEVDSRVLCVPHPSGCFHGRLVLFGEARQHLGLEAPRQGEEGQEAEDEQCELPAEVEGHEDGHTDVGQRVDDHANLRARGLWRRERENVSTCALPSFSEKGLDEN